MPPQLDSGMFERLPFDCAMFDGKVDIPEYKVDDVDGETLPTAPCLMVKLLYLNIKYMMYMVKPCRKSVSSGKR